VPHRARENAKQGSWLSDTSSTFSPISLGEYCKRRGVLYVGVTNDLARRTFEHKLKATAGFTSKYGVSRLAYFEEHDSILQARDRERALKRWRRAWKIKLVEDLNPTWRDLYEDLILL
jgi:putative endonuclease